MADPKDPQVEAIVVKVAKMELEPGDTVIIRSTRFLQLDELAVVRQMMRKAIPEGHEILFFQPDMEIMVLRNKKSKAGVVIPQ